MATSMLTEKELLDIVDSLIRDAAYNRPAAVAIGMAVGAAVEAEVRRRIADRTEPADRDVALELSWVPVAQRGANWHAHATVQLRALHAANHAAEKTPRDPLEIEELWDEANELATGDGPEPHELFARLLERAHGIGGEHG